VPAAPAREPEPSLMPRRSPSHALLLVALFAIVALLTGCGQKGDLYLPDEPPAQVDEDADA
jgi:predicted small lipoprotein YifL